MTVEAVPDYTPPPVDLAPFRAGTVWRCLDAGYLVVRSTFDEQVRHHVTRTIPGQPVLVDVRPATHPEMRMTLDRADWADTLPTAYEIGTSVNWDVGIPVVVTSGQCWMVANFEPVFISPGGWGRLGSVKVAPLPDKLEVTLWRHPAEDQTCSTT